LIFDFDLKELNFIINYIKIIPISTYYINTGPKIIKIYNNNTRIAYSAAFDQVVVHQILITCPKTGQELVTTITSPTILIRGLIFPKTFIRFKFSQNNLWNIIHHNHVYCIITVQYNYLSFLVRLLYGLCVACCPSSTLTVEGCSDDNEKQVLIEEFSKSVYTKKTKRIKIIALFAHPSNFKLNGVHVHTRTRLTRWHFSGVLFAIWH